MSLRLWKSAAADDEDGVQAMIVSEYSTLEGRSLLRISATTPAQGSVGEETARTLESALDAIRDAGFSPENIVRSRLFTRDRKSRQEASDARRALLAGPLRGASSSFFDSDRLPGETRVQLDLEALAAASGPTKRIVEYDPPIAPPKFVALDGLVFLSGITDTGPGLTVQVPAIAAAIRASLADAGTDLSRARRVAVYLALEESPQEALALIDKAMPGLPCPVTLSRVGGYSAPEKRIEIEVTAASA
jgi:enamine deaminase RidA (YjgF/YER057c/UK114 family)